jgi:hypothetical protein
MAAEQLSLFADKLPHRPYCSDNKTASRIRLKRIALNYPYISVNPPHLRFWMTFDMDKEGGLVAWEDAGLAMPNIGAGSPKSGTAHLLYGLDAPVLTTNDARIAPLRYLAAVEAAYLAKLEPYGADRGFAGLMVKNPTHTSWKAFWGRMGLYSLAELGEYVDLKKFNPKRATLKDLDYGVGRNVTIFNYLGPEGKWAYQAMRRYRGEPFELWRLAVYDKAMELNFEFPCPLGEREVAAISKSVAKWVWRNDKPAERKFRARQAYKGKLGGLAKGAANEDKRASARLMHAAGGMSQRDIATELGVSVGSVNAWLKGVQIA